MPAAAQAVLDFWFLPEGDPGHGGYRPEWFRKDPAFDSAIRERFGPEVEDALAGRRDGWNAGAEGCLALVLLLDQFTRNVFRDTPRAFAGDAAALGLAESAVGDGRDLALPPIRRWFLYLPFMHAESLPAQERCVALFRALGEAGGAAFDSPLDYAMRHRDVIARFGRFPHRNSILGRESTVAESAFLTLPGSSF
ncbi:MAG: DUF924 domain-containing protein [Rhodocyclaceae bacterium]|nr:DUF924 domain-containing protein [Rhodocyclaceae bacterium]